MYTDFTPATLNQYITKQFPDMKIIYEDEGWTVYADHNRKSFKPPKFTDYSWHVRVLINEMARLKKCDMADFIAELIELQKSQKLE